MQGYSFAIAAVKVTTNLAVQNHKFIILQFPWVRSLVSAQEFTLAELHCFMEELGTNSRSGSFRFQQNSVPCSCRTESTFPSWLAMRGCFKLLEVPISFALWPSPCIFKVSNGSWVLSKLHLSDHSHRESYPLLLAHVIKLDILR